jgi:hypothetical protein
MDYAPISNVDDWKKIEKYIIEKGEDIKKTLSKSKYHKLAKIERLYSNSCISVFLYIKKELPNITELDKKTMLNIAKKYIEYTLLKIGYQEFKDGLIKLLKVDYKTGVKSLSLLETIRYEEYDYDDNDELYKGNIIYKIKVEKTKTEKNKPKFKYVEVDKGTDGAIKCYACVCGWCQDDGLHNLCIYTSRYYEEGHFILGVVCMDNLLKFARLEKDADVKDILLKMVEDLKEKHKDLNKKKCKGCDKRNVIRNREKEKGPLIGNYCKECIKTHRICKDCKEVFKFRENYEKKCDKCYSISKGKCIPIKVEYKFNN